MFDAGYLKETYFKGFKNVVNERKLSGEWELLLVNPDGTMGNTSRIWPQLIELGWVEIGENKKITGCLELKTGWMCKAGFGLGTLEVITAPETNLCFLVEKEASIISDIKFAAEKAGMFLVGLGIQPVTCPEEKKWQNNACYKAIRPRLPGIEVATVTASCKSQIEVARNEVVQFFRILNYLSGPMIALTANSAVWRGVLDSSRSAVREDVWNSFIGSARERSGILPWFENEDDIIYHLINLPFLIFNDKRNGGAVKSYGGTFQSFIFEKAQQITEPDIREFFCEHERCIWSSVRPRTKFGSLEIRPNCQTPPWMSRTGVHALHLGIIENSEKADKLIRRYMHSEWVGMRREFINKGFDALYGNFPLQYVVRDMFLIAEEGLIKRGKGEEKLLVELKNIAFRGAYFPAKIAQNEFLKGGVSALIETFKF